MKAVDKFDYQRGYKFRQVLTMRFGLEGQKECTLAEVGKALSLSRERVRQIEVEALTKLRGPLEERRLREALEE